MLTVDRNGKFQLAHLANVDNDGDQVADSDAIAVSQSPDCLSWTHSIGSARQGKLANFSVLAQNIAKTFWRSTFTIDATGIEEKVPGNPLSDTADGVVIFLHAQPGATAHVMALQAGLGNVPNPSACPMTPGTPLNNDKKEPAWAVTWPTKCIANGENLNVVVDWSSSDPAKGLGVSAVVWFNEGAASGVEVYDDDPQADPSTLLKPKDYQPLNIPPDADGMIISFEQQPAAKIVRVFAGGKSDSTNQPQADCPQAKGLWLASDPKPTWAVVWPEKCITNGEYITIHVFWKGPPQQGLGIQGVTWLHQLNPNGEEDYSATPLKPKSEAPDPLKPVLGELDKPWIAADLRNGPAPAGNIYLCWTEGFVNGRPGEHIRASHGPPGGPFAEAPGGAIRTAPTGRELNGCQIAVASNGTVLLSWWESDFGGANTTINAAECGPGLVGCAMKPVPAVAGIVPIGVPKPACGQVLDFAGIGREIRVNQFPSMAINHAKPNKGEVYLVWNGKNAQAGNSNIYFTKRAVSGGAWAAPIMISIEPPEGKKEQFMPAIAVAPNGNIKVTWYTQRDADRVQLWESFSDDNGATWVQKPVSVGPNVPFGVPITNPEKDPEIGQCYMGDYNGITADAASSFHMVWGDNRVKIDKAYWRSTFAVDATGILEKTPGDPLTATADGIVISFHPQPGTTARLQSLKAGLGNAPNASPCPLIAGKPLADDGKKSVWLVNWPAQCVANGQNVKVVADWSSPDVVKGLGIWAVTWQNDGNPSGDEVYDADPQQAPDTLLKPKSVEPVTNNEPDPNVFYAAEPEPNGTQQGPFTFTNNAAAASDLEVVFAGTGGTLNKPAVTQNPPGCPPPTLNVQGGNTVVINWSKKCVPKGAVVQVTVYSKFAPISPDSVTWTNAGTAIPTQTATPTRTGTPATSTPTRTGTPATNTPTRTGTPATNTPTRTGTPATSTPTRTATATPLPNSPGGVYTRTIAYCLQNAPGNPGHTLADTQFGNKDGVTTPHELHICILNGPAIPVLGFLHRAADANPQEWPTTGSVNTKIQDENPNQRFWGLFAGSSGLKGGLTDWGVGQDPCILAEALLKYAPGWDMSRVTLLDEQRTTCQSPAPPLPIAGHATKPNIAQKLQDIKSQAQPGDEVVFLLAGHGNGQNVSDHLGNPISGTDIANMLSTKGTVGFKKGVTITVIINACLSGGILDQIKAQVVAGTIRYEDGQPIGPSNLSVLTAADRNRCAYGKPKLAPTPVPNRAGGVYTRTIAYCLQNDVDKAGHTLADTQFGNQDGVTTPHEVHVCVLNAPGMLVFGTPIRAAVSNPLEWPEGGSVNTKIQDEDPNQRFWGLFAGTSATKAGQAEVGAGQDPCILAEALFKYAPGWDLDRITLLDEQRTACQPPAPPFPLADAATAANIDDALNVDSDLNAGNGEDGGFKALVEPGDEFIFLLAGHGVDGYVLDHDGTRIYGRNPDPPDPDAAESDLVTMLSDFPKDVTITVIINSCHAGEVLNDIKGITDVNGDEVGPDNLSILASSDKDTCAYGKPKLSPCPPGLAPNETLGISGAGDELSPCQQKLPRLQNLFLNRQGTKIPPLSCLAGTDGAVFEETLSVPIPTVPDPKDPTRPQQLGAFEFEVHFDDTKVCVNIVPGPAADDMICVVEDKDSSTLEGVARIGCVTQGKTSFPDTTTEDGRHLADIIVRPQPDVYSQAKPDQDNGVVAQLNNVLCELSDLQGHPIPLFSCEDADLTMRYLEGDVEPDCSVNALDAQAIAFRWGVEKGSLIFTDFMNLEPSDPQADNDIDIKDLQFVYGRFGSTCAVPHPPQEPVNAKA